MDCQNFSLQAWNLFPSKLLSTLSNQSLLERQMASTWKMSYYKYYSLHPRGPYPHILKHFWKMLHPASGAFQSGGCGEQAVLQGKGPGGPKPHLEKVLDWFLYSKWRRKTIDKEAGVGKTKQGKRRFLWSLQTWAQILKMLSSVSLIQRNSFWLRWEEKISPLRGKQEEKEVIRMWVRPREWLAKAFVSRGGGVLFSVDRTLWTLGKACLLLLISFFSYDKILTPLSGGKVRKKKSCFFLVHFFPRE